MIPLPTARALTSAMLVGVAVGLVAGLASVFLAVTVRPDVAVAVVLGIPSLVGLVLVVFAGRRWMVAAGVFFLAVAPAWFGALVAIEVVVGG